MTRDELVEKMLEGYCASCGIPDASREYMRTPISAALAAAAEELLKNGQETEAWAVKWPGDSKLFLRHFNAIVTNRKSAYTQPKTAEPVEDLLKESRTKVAMGTGDHQRIEGLIREAFRRGKESA